MLHSSFIFDLTKKKFPARKSWMKLMIFSLLTTFDSNLFIFLAKSDEFHQPAYFRTPESNIKLLNAVSNTSMNHISFNTDSYPLVIDSGASSSATPFKSDYIDSTYKTLEGVIISGIASGLKTASIGSVSYKIKDDNRNSIDLEINKVLHLEKLPIRLLSP